MSDHIVYSRPLIVTEDRQKEALQKQLKQRAFKEALDKQTALSNKWKNTKIPEKVDSGVPSDPIEQRYTFSYENGNGRFIRVDNTGHTRSSEKVEKSPSRRMEKQMDKAEALIPGQKKYADPTVASRPAYQSNSLPPNFAMSTSEANPLVPKRSEYNTNSLPVEIVYGKTRHTGGSGVVSPHIRDLLPRGKSPQRSSFLLESPRDPEYQTNCLPHNFNLDDVRMQMRQQQQQQQPPPPQQQQQQQQQRSPMTPGRAKLSVAVNQSPFTQASNTPKRPGVPLPPLVDADGPSSRRVSNVASPLLAIGGSPALEWLRVQPPNGGNGRLLKPKCANALRGRSNEARVRPVHGHVAPRSVQTRVTETKVERLQKELESREFEMAKMREKERNWEEQVKQLKLELKDARKKQRDLNKLVMEGPRRAETAPDQPLVSPPVLGHPSRALKKGTGGQSAFVLGKRHALAESRTFMETFRPISAPSDTVSTSYVPPEQQETLSPLQDSFKCASVLTRKTAFGLPGERANRPVPIEYEHLLQFVDEHIITQQQADELWRLFANELSPLALIHRQSGGFQGCNDPTLTQCSKQLLLKTEMHMSKHDIAEKEEDVGFDEAGGERGARLDSINGCSDMDSLAGRDTFETSSVLHMVRGHLSEEDTSDE